MTAWVLLKALNLLHWPQAEDTLAAIGTFILGGELRSGQQIARIVLELSQGGLADAVDGAAAQGRQSAAQGGQIRRMHESGIKTALGVLAILFMESERARIEATYT